MNAAPSDPPVQRAPSVLVYDRPWEPSATHRPAPHAAWVAWAPMTCQSNRGMAGGGGATVTDADPETDPVVAVINAVPAATAVTVAVAPVPDTVATAGLPEVQETVGLVTGPVVLTTVAVRPPVAPMARDKLAGATDTETIVGGGGGGGGGGGTAPGEVEQPRIPVNARAAGPHALDPIDIRTSFGRGMGDRRGPACAPLRGRLGMGRRPPRYRSPLPLRMTDEIPSTGGWPEDEGPWGTIPVPLERDDLDRLYSAAYAELKRLARSVRRRDRGHSLTTTALVNEAWLKLARSPTLTVHSGVHFKRVVVRAMRQLLVEAARRRRAAKRGGGEDLVVTIPDDLLPGMAPDDYVIALDEALARLAARYPRQARTVETRYFGGFDVHETAAVLDISRATVERDCRFAKAWLRAEIEASS